MLGRSFFVLLCVFLHFLSYCLLCMYSHNMSFYEEDGNIKDSVGGDVCEA